MPFHSLAELLKSHEIPPGMRLVHQNSPFQESKKCGWGVGHCLTELPMNKGHSLPCPILYGTLLPRIVGETRLLCWTILSSVLHIVSVVTVRLTVMDYHDQLQRALSLVETQSCNIGNQHGWRSRSYHWNHRCFL